MTSVAPVEENVASGTLEAVPFWYCTNVVVVVDSAQLAVVKSQTGFSSAPRQYCRAAFAQRAAATQAVVTATLALLARHNLPHRSFLTFSFTFMAAALVNDDLQTALQEAEDVVDKFLDGH